MNSSAVPSIDAKGAKDLLLENEYLTSEELQGILPEGVRGHHLNRMRQRGKLVALRFAHRGYLYPAFQVDRSFRRIRPVASKVNRLLLTHGTPEDAIAWWFATDPHGHTPRYRMLDSGDDLQTAAREYADAGRSKR